MHVMLVSSNGSLKNGASQALLSLAMGLSASGEDVIVLLPNRGDLAKALTKAGIRSTIINQHNGLWIRPVKNEHIHGKQLIFRLKRRLVITMLALRVGYQIVTNRIDIIHINALTTGLVASVARLFHLPVVWHVREFLEEGIGAEFVDKKFSENLVEESSMVIAISDVVRKEVIRRLPRANVRLLYDGVKNIVPIHNEILSNNRISILSVGRIMPLKGQGVLIDVVKSLADSGIDVHVIFVGEIEDSLYYDGLQEKIHNYSLENNFEYHGFKTDLTHEYTNADIVCITTSIEAFGLTTVEAMRFGCLVIGADTGATPEIVADRSTGLIYDHCDPVKSLTSKLSWVAKHRDEAKKIALDGQSETQKRYTLAENVQGVLDIYHHVINQGVINE